MADETPLGVPSLTPQELSLTDRLAVERTAMANERTLLSYIRTSLALIVVGVTILKFFHSSSMHTLAYFIIPVGAVAGVVGLMKYLEVRARLGEYCRK